MRWLWAVVLLGVLALLLPHDSFAQDDEPPLVLVMDIDGPIEPITERYLSRVIDKALSRDAEALVIRIDTPGGLISSMRKLAEQLLNSPVPTVAYVWPSGAQAASAGDDRDDRGSHCGDGSGDQHRRGGAGDGNG